MYLSFSLLNKATFQSSSGECERERQPFLVEEVIKSSSPAGQQLSVRLRCFLGVNNGN